MNETSTDTSNWHERFAQELRYRLKYNPETGNLIWVRSRDRKTNGKVAGYTPKSGYSYLYLGRHRYPVAGCVFAWHHGWLPTRVFRADGNPRNHRIENLYV